MAVPPVWDTIIPPMWDDRPLVIVGTGPSLVNFDYNRLQGLGRVLAIKAALWDLPFADACIGIDRKWMLHYAKQIEERAKQIPIYLSVDTGEFWQYRKAIPSAKFVELIRRSNSFQKHRIECGSTSGFAGLSLGYMKRAPLIVLFGFDYRADGKVAHVNNAHYAHNPTNINKKAWPIWATYFDGTVDQLALANIRVVNACPESCIEAFEKMSIDQAIELLQTW